MFVVPVPSVVGLFEYSIFTSFVLSKIVAASLFNTAEYVIFISAPVLSFNFANSVGLNVIVNVVPSPLGVTFFVQAVYVSPPIVTVTTVLSVNVNPFDNVSVTINLYESYPTTFGTLDVTV